MKNYNPTTNSKDKYRIKVFNVIYDQIINSIEQMFSELVIYSQFYFNFSFS